MHRATSFLFRFRTYWLEYSTRAAAALWSLLLISLATTWATWSTLEGIFNPAEKFTSWAQAPVTFLVILVALFGGTLVAAAFRADPRIEDDEDKSVSPWKAVNHSFPQRRWAALDKGEQQRTAQAVSQHQSMKMFFLDGLDPTGQVYERLLEETTSDHIRTMSLLAPARLIRVDKTGDFDRALLDLKCRLELADFIRQRGIFDERWISCLIPIPARKSPTFPTPMHITGGDLKRMGVCVLSNDGLSHQRTLYQIFPYIPLEHHYSGQLDELESVAEKFGSLQAAISGLETSLVPEHRRLVEFISRTQPSTSADGPATRRPLKARLRAQEIQDQWSSVCSAAAQHSDGNRFAELFRSKGPDGKILSDFVSQYIDDIIAAYSTKGHEYLLLHDIHPHNVLTHNGKCELIFDYSWAGIWDHAEILAFSLHRFVREHIRTFQKDVGFETACARSSLAFIQSYRKGLGTRDLKLPSDFGNGIDRYMSKPTIEKLLSCLQVGMDMKRDEGSRSQERLLGEAKKFIRFLHEARAIARSAGISKLNKFANVDFSH